MILKFRTILLFSGAIFFTVFTQLIIKWQVKFLGSFPLKFDDKISYFGHIITNKWIISAIIASFATMFLWILILNEMELSYAYPFYIGLTFSIIIVLSSIFFGETITAQKSVSILLILIGIVIGSISYK
jgi:multidrug transporter EmrE-like cation transporter